MSDEFIELGVVDMTPVESKPKSRQKKKNDESSKDQDSVSEPDNANSARQLGVYRAYQGAELPSYATNQAACFDLKAYLGPEISEVKGFNSQNEPIVLRVRDGKVVLPPGARVLIPTGLIFDIPEGRSLKILPRSSTGLKTGLELPNSVGCIDADYVEETFMILKNASTSRVTVESGQRLLQAEIVQCEQVEITEIKVAPSKKGNRVGGLGSTGKN